MTQASDKSDAVAEKAYAEAVAEVKPAKAAPTVAPVAEAPKPVAAKKTAAPVEKAPLAKKAAAPKAKPAPAAKKPATPKKPAAAKKPAVAAKKTPKKSPITKSPITKSKETTMATTDFAASMTETLSTAVADMQGKLQESYDKSASLMTEATDFAKGNVEAVVESGKILAGGVQNLGQSAADEAKSIYEVATADLKEMAAIKSPTELFQLQGKIMRRNFDALIAATSKNSDAAMKLVNDAAAPISGRVNMAAEKLSKVA